MNEEIKSYVEVLIQEFEKQSGKQLTEVEKELFFYAFDKGMEAAENIGTFL
jgi:hypothetical protein